MIRREGEALCGSHSVRVRYRDTDLMGVVYHSVYLEFFETGRTEFLREAGIPYSEIEEKGLMLPLLGYSATINRPAYYDDLLRIESRIHPMQGVRLRISYAIFRGEEPDPLVTGETIHAFASTDSFAARRPPRYFLDLFDRE